MRGGGGLGAGRGGRTGPLVHALGLGQAGWIGPIKPDRPDRRFSVAHGLVAGNAGTVVEQAELSVDENGLRCRVHPGAVGVETLIYLPGLHGDWTLLGPFREALAGRCRLVEFTYPRRTDWNLDDYARAVLAELARHEIHHGWILGESFSSQVAWALAGICLQSRDDDGAGPREAGFARFRVRGITLVGGFVRHPVPWGVGWARSVSAWVPSWLLGGLCRAYGRWARGRCAGAGAGAGAGEIDLFVARRLNQADRAAITCRYDLIRGHDLRPVARSVRWPVYALTGAVDPIVPWPPVARWLRRQCPGFRAGRVVWGAG